jgi:Vitamin B12 dependent methionine synthase, activation domain
MAELHDIPFVLDAELLMRQLRIQPGTDSATAFAELLARVTEVGRPKATYEVCYIEEKADESVVLNGVRLTSRALRRNLDPVERVFPYVATCGTEADAIAVPHGDAVQAFWLWTMKEALLDAATAYLYDHLAARYRMTHWATMDPGSGDADLWPIEQQKELFSVLGDVETRIGVRLTDSMLMIPTMSVSGIVFPTETEFASCQVCHREDCPRRAAPFDETVWRAVCGD